MMPEIEANGFLAVCVGLFALITIASAAVKFWRLFFPSKNTKDQPITREEFEAAQSASEEFRSQIREDISGLRENVSRLEEAVKAQNENFMHSVAGLRRAAEQNQRSLEGRLNSIEVHLRR